MVRYFVQAYDEKNVITTAITVTVSYKKSKSELANNSFQRYISDLIALKLSETKKITEDHSSWAEEAHLH